MKHQCHNREFPETTMVQDGWRDVVIEDLSLGAIRTRVPSMTLIPFKMSRECHQWNEQGAITIGLLDPAGCEGCKWIPEDAEKSLKITVRLALIDGTSTDEINASDWMFVIDIDPATVVGITYTTSEMMGVWHEAVVESHRPIKLGDTVKFRGRW